MRSDRQRFIDSCLVAAFAQAPDRSSRFLVERAAAFWDDREFERLRYLDAHPGLAKTQPKAERKARSA